MMDDDDVFKYCYITERDLLDPQDVGVLIDSFIVSLFLSFLNKKTLFHFVKHTSILPTYNLHIIHSMRFFF